MLNIGDPSPRRDRRATKLPDNWLVILFVGFGLEGNVLGCCGGQTRNSVRRREETFSVLSWWHSGGLSSKPVDAAMAPKGADVQTSRGSRGEHFDD